MLSSCRSSNNVPYFEGQGRAASRLDPYSSPVVFPITNLLTNHILDSPSRQLSQLAWWLLSSGLIVRSRAAAHPALQLYNMYIITAPIRPPCFPGLRSNRLICYAKGARKAVRTKRLLFLQTPSGLQATTCRKWSFKRYTAHTFFDAGLLRSSCTKK